MKKRVLIIAIITVLVVAIVFPMSAFARGHCGGGYNTGSTRYALCDVDGCYVTGVHMHDGTYCGGHYIGDGHDYHEVCNVSNCRKTGVHAHDGEYCFPHYNGDGHSYHNSGRRGGCR